MNFSASTWSTGCVAGRLTINQRDIGCTCVASIDSSFDILLNIGLAIEHWIGYDTVSYFNNIGHWFGPMILVCVIYMQKVSGVLGPGEKRILGMCRGTRSHFHPSGGSGGSSFSTGGGAQKNKKYEWTIHWLRSSHRTRLACLGRGCPPPIRTFLILVCLKRLFSSSFLRLSLKNGNLFLNHTKKTRKQISPFVKYVK